MAVGWYGHSLDYIEVSPRMGAALSLQHRGNKAQRQIIVDKVSEGLSLDTHLIGPEAFMLLSDIVNQLDAALRDDPGHWLTDLMSGRHQDIVAAAVDGVADDDLLTVVEDLGWGHCKIRQGVRFTDVHSEARQLLQDFLAQRVFRLVDRWRASGAWAKIPA